MLVQATQTILTPFFPFFPRALAFRTTGLTNLVVLRLVVKVGPPTPGYVPHHPPTPSSTCGRMMARHYGTVPPLPVTAPTSVDASMKTSFLSTPPSHSSRTTQLISPCYSVTTSPVSTHLLHHPRISSRSSILSIHPQDKPTALWWSLSTGEDIHQDREHDW